MGISNLTRVVTLSIFLRVPHVGSDDEPPEAFQNMHTSFDDELPENKLSH